jgi:hypothetical protein
MALYLYPVLKPLYTTQREVTQLKAEYDSLQTRNVRMREEVDRLKTPAGVEQVARDTLGYVRPGEKAYVVMPSPQDNATGKVPAATKSSGTATATAGKAPVKKKSTLASSTDTTNAALATTAPVDTWWKAILRAVFGAGAAGGADKAGAAGR